MHLITCYLDRICGLIQLVSSTTCSEEAWIDLLDLPQPPESIAAVQPPPQITPQASKGSQWKSSPQGSKPATTPKQSKKKPTKAALKKAYEVEREEMNWEQAAQWKNELNLQMEQKQRAAEERAIEEQK
jgi:hypothetical protein